MVNETKRKVISITPSVVVTLPIRAKQEWGIKRGDKLNCLLLGQHLIISPLNERQLQDNGIGRITGR